MSKVTLAADHSAALYEQIRAEIIAFNAPFFADCVREPLGFSLRDDNGLLIGGVTGKTFGLWLLLDFLWVATTVRGQGHGLSLLQQAEHEARARGCQFVLLDTLEFQAAPFYQRHGYQIVFTQACYPTTGAKHFMVKSL